MGNWPAQEIRSTIKKGFQMCLGTVRAGAALELRWSLLESNGVKLGYVSFVVSLRFFGLKCVLYL